MMQIYRPTESEKIKGRNHFYAQLVREGLAYQKPENRMDKAPVGLDMGPSTIAVVVVKEESRESKREIRRLPKLTLLDS
jgi:putative transposase